VAIFTTNSEKISEPIKRRMHYVLKFKNPGTELRRRLLHREIEQLQKKLGVRAELSDSDIERLASQFPIAGGFVSQAMMLAMARSPAGTLTASAVELALEHHLDTSSEDPGDEVRTPRVALHAVKLDSKQKDELNRFIGFARRVVESPSRENGLLPAGATLLLSGPPGTGKTLTAEAIASELGLPFRRLSPSSLLSKWVGETESRIRGAFRKAMREPMVLMIDEAEGLFSSRERAQRNWEVTQINEFLQQVEGFRGVLVIATNHVELMDEAFARRFVFHLKLDVPAPETRLDLWRLWQNELQLSDADVLRLAREVELTGGEIRNTAVRAVARSSLNVSEIFDIAQEVASQRTGRRHRKVGLK
jgi:SpoVK/Ycf46/Vps4 family AAA+-type ATPase